MATMEGRFLLRLQNVAAKAAAEGSDCCTAAFDKVVAVADQGTAADHDEEVVMAICPAALTCRGSVRKAPVQPALVLVAVVSLQKKVSEEQPPLEFALFHCC